jgi:hypothetical protein
MYEAPLKKGWANICAYVIIYTIYISQKIGLHTLSSYYLQVTLAFRNTFECDRFQNRALHKPFVALRTHVPRVIPLLLLPMCANVTCDVLACRLKFRELMSFSKLQRFLPLDGLLPCADSLGLKL